jgi:hypothetical protein
MNETGEKLNNIKEVRRQVHPTPEPSGAKTRVAISRKDISVHVIRERHVVHVNTMMQSGYRGCFSGELFNARNNPVGNPGSTDRS